MPTPDRHITAEQYRRVRKPRRPALSTIHEDQVVEVKPKSHHFKTIYSSPRKKAPGGAMGSGILVRDTSMIDLLQGSGPDLDDMYGRSSARSVGSVFGAVGDGRPYGPFTPSYILKMHPDVTLSVEKVYDLRPRNGPGSRKLAAISEEDDMQDYLPTIRQRPPLQEIAGNMRIKPCIPLPPKLPQVHESLPTVIPRRIPPEQAPVPLLQRDSAANEESRNMVLQGMVLEGLGANPGMKDIASMLDPQAAPFVPAWMTGANTDQQQADLPENTQHKHEPMASQTDNTVEDDSSARSPTTEATDTASVVSGSTEATLYSQAEAEPELTPKPVRNVGRINARPSRAKPAPLRDDPMLSKDARRELRQWNPARNPVQAILDARVKAIAAAHDTARFAQHPVDAGTVNNTDITSTIDSIDSAVVDNHDVEEERVVAVAATDGQEGIVEKVEIKAWGGKKFSEILTKPAPCVSPSKRPMQALGKKK